MKDQFFLLLAGLALALAAWAFWHSLGEEASIILLTAVIVGLVLDNRRMRKEIKRLKEGSC